MSQTCLEFCLDAIGMLLGGTSARANDGVGMTYVQALTHNGNGRWSPRIEAMLCFVDTFKTRYDCAMAKFGPYARLSRQRLESAS